MRANLSLETIGAALAVLGTSAVIAACGSSQPSPSSPVQANEVQGAGGGAAGAQGSCSAAANCAASAHKGKVPAGHANCSAAAHCGADAHDGGTTP